MADSIDDDWESSSKSSTHSDVPEPPSVTNDARSEHYRVNVGGEEIAVMSTLELLDALKTGRVSAQSLVWKKGMSDWAELGRVPALALLVPSAPKVPSVTGAPSNAPSSPPSAPASNAPSSPPTSAPPKSSPLSPATPVGARRSALPRSPMPSRVDLSAVRSTSPPVPRPSRPSMASIPHMDIPPLGSVPSNPRPSTPVASRRDDDDDDDGVTQVVTTLKMRALQESRGKTSASPPPADDKALAVYERPLATLAFAEGVAEDEAKPQAGPGSVAPARIISVGPSEPPKAPPRSAPPPSPSRSAAPPPSRPASPPPPSRPAAMPAQEGAPALARPRQPSLPSIVVATAPSVASPAAPAPVPDSLEPVTAQDAAETTAAEQEYTHAGKRRRSLVTRNLVLASAGSALFASLVTAIALHRSEPTPLVIAPNPPLASSTVAQVAAPVRASEPPPKEAPPAVPVLSLSALPKAAPTSKTVRPKVEAPAVVSPAPSFLAEATEGAKPKAVKSSLDENPYGVELEDDEEPAPKAKPVNPAPAWLQEGLKGEDPPSAQNPGF